MTVPTSTSTIAEPGEAAANGSVVSRVRRWGWGWLVGALVIGLLAGLSGGYLLTRPSAPTDTSAEAGFLRDMSTPHAQAVEMSMIEHQKTDNPLLVTLSDDIALTQQAQIGYMQGWLRQWNLSPTGSQPAMAWMPGGTAEVVNGLMPGMATPTQMAALGKATGKDLDIQYLTLMRQHHLGGIHMAQEILTRTTNPDVTFLAQSMVQNQQGEITVISGYLKQLGAA
jgi:uncharacterized protein (DUF305 family)